MTPEKKQLEKFLAKYTPAMAARGRQALAKIRKRLPGAIEMVYDNYNGLVIGFGPTTRPSEAIFSIVVLPDHVTLCFLQGAGLPDPRKFLRGSGNVVRHVRLNELSLLDEPEIRKLMDQALRHAKVPMNPAQRHQLIIKSVSAKQRPRRPARKIG